MTDDEPIGELDPLSVRDGTFRVEDGEDEVLAFTVRPTKAFGFPKGDTFSQTRWRFQEVASP